MVGLSELHFRIVIIGIVLNIFNIIHLFNIYIINIFNFNIINNICYKLLLHVCKERWSGLLLLSSNTIRLNF